MAYNNVVTPTRLSTAHCTPTVCRTSHRLLPLDTVSDTVKFPQLGTVALIQRLPWSDHHYIAIIRPPTTPNLAC